MTEFLLYKGGEFKWHVKDQQLLKLDAMRKQADLYRSRKLNDAKARQSFKLLGESLNKKLTVLPQVVPLVEDFSECPYTEYNFAMAIYEAYQ